MALIELYRIDMAHFDRRGRRIDRELQFGDRSPAGKSRTGELADDPRQLQGMELQLARSDQHQQREVAGAGVEFLHWCGFGSRSASDREQRSDVYLDAVQPSDRA